MAGFLDKRDRIIDMTLTGYGKSALSKGKLKFAFWSAFDDEVDYDPFVSDSGSMSSTELEDARVSQTEECLVREVTVGYKIFNLRSEDPTNSSYKLLSIPQGQSRIPRMEVSGLSESGSITITVDMQETKDGFMTKNSSDANLILGYARGSYPMKHSYDGFLVRVFNDDSSVLTEVFEKLDSRNRISFNDDLIVKL